MPLLAIPILLLLACTGAVAYHYSGWPGVLITTMAYTLGYAIAHWSSC